MVQRILSLLMIDGACSKHTSERFNHVGLCLSPTGTRKMLDGLGSFQTAEIIERIRDGTSFRVVGDNFDLLIKVRQMLLENRNKSHHWFNLLLIFSRVSSSHLPNNTPIFRLSDFPPEEYFLSEGEKTDTLNDLAILASRVLCDHLSFLVPYKSTVVKHIPHQYSKEMSQVSPVLASGTVFKDEKKYDEMVDIMDHVQKEVHRYYSEAFKDGRRSLFIVVRARAIVGLTTPTNAWKCAYAYEMGHSDTSELVQS